MSQNGKSILTLLNLYVENISYTAIESSNSNEPILQFSREVSEASDGAHEVRLGVAGNYENGAAFSIVMVGVFRIETSEPINENAINTLYKDNTVAIMFPFLRTQLSLLTTQPGISPVLIQPMNIVKLFEEAENESQSEE